MRVHIVHALSALFITAGVAMAQEFPAQQTQLQQPFAADKQPIDSRVEVHAASRLVLANKEQTAINEYAQDRVQDDKVKEFAKKMAHEHKDRVSTLKKFAPYAASLELKAESRDGSDQRPSAEQTRSPGGQTLRPNQLGDELLKLERRTAEKCLQLTREQLQEIDGKELDKAYLAQQIGAHTAMLAKLSASEQSTSGALKDHIEESKEATKKHLDEAKKLLKDVESDS